MDPVFKSVQVTVSDASGQFDCWDVTLSTAPDGSASLRQTHPFKEGEQIVFLTPEQVKALIWELK